MREVSWLDETAVDAWHGGTIGRLRPAGFDEPLTSRRQGDDVQRGSVEHGDLPPLEQTLEFQIREIVRDGGTIAAVNRELEITDGDVPERAHNPQDVDFRAAQLVRRASCSDDSSFGASWQVHRRPLFMGGGLRPSRGCGDTWRVVGPGIGDVSCVAIGAAA